LLERDRVFYFGLLGAYESGETEHGRPQKAMAYPT
jgi:hypothetical protein